MNLVINKKITINTVSFLRNIQFYKLHGNLPWISYYHIRTLDLTLFVAVTVVVTVLVTTDVTATALTNTGENRIERVTNLTAVVNNITQIFMVNDHKVTAGWV